MKLNHLIHPLLAMTFGLCAIDAAELKSQFQSYKRWNYFGDVEAKKRDLDVKKRGDDVVSNISSTGKFQRAEFLRTKEKYQDMHMNLEFMVPEGADSGVYVMGRYEIQIADSAGKKKPSISDVGALAQRWNNKRNPKGFQGVAPKVNAAKPAGKWQTLEIIFRAPRFAKDGSKTHHAKFIKVLVNGQLALENQVAKGPSRSSEFADESADPESIFIQGNISPVAIRNFEVKKLELSTDGETPLKGSEAAPLDKKGQPQINAVALGEEIFKSKGCMECHSTAAGEIKTGPSMRGIFTLMGRNVDVLEVDEGHKKSLPANLDYLKSSLRRPTEALAMKADGTNHLPIMPAYDFKAINDDEVKMLYSYLLTLNAPKDAGPKAKWVKKPQSEIRSDEGSYFHSSQGLPKTRAS